MGSIRRALIVSILAPALALAAGPAAEDQRESPEPIHDEPETVQMVELGLRGRTLRGRLASETESTIHIEPPGQTVVGYPRETVREIRLFRIPLVQYHEEVGDACRERIWEVDDGPAMVVKARRAYQEALRHAAGQRDSARLEAKIEELAAEREELHGEALKREELRKAAQETEKARIEKELAQKELDARERQERLIQGLHQIARRLDERLDRIEDVVEDMDERIEDIEDDIDRLYYRNRLHITSRIFLQLRDSHVQLAGRVERLESELAAD